MKITSTNTRKTGGMAQLLADLASVTLAKEDKAKAKTKTK